MVQDQNSSLSSGDSFELSGYSASLDPEEVLMNLVVDLRHFVNSIEGFAGLLAYEEAVQEAKEMIPIQTLRARLLLDHALTYLKDRRKLKSDGQKPSE